MPVSVLHPTALNADAARVEIAGQEYPIRRVQGDQLTLAEYRQPARSGDQLRFILKCGPADADSIPCLAVVIKATGIAAELVCRVDANQPRLAIALRRLAERLPSGAAAPVLRAGWPSYPNGRLPWSLPRSWPWRWSRLPALLALALTAGLAALVLDGVRSALGTIRLDAATIALPPGPVMAAVEPVVARERGLVDQIYGREGMPVSPGQPLFSTRYDPRIDLDLLDRAAARELAHLEARLRDRQSSADALAEQITLLKQELRFFPPGVGIDRLRTIAQQLTLARQQRQRRRLLLHQGGISQDSYDVTVDRVLELEARQQQAGSSDRLDQARRGRLQALRQLQHRHNLQIAALLAERQRLQRGLEQRRSLRRQTPLPLYALANPSRDQTLYKAAAAGVILRQLKQPGATVQANEAVFLVQNQRLPPFVQAEASAADRSALSLNDVGVAEIAAIRQRYPVKLVSSVRNPAGTYSLRFAFLDLQANDQRQIETFQGKAVRLWLRRGLNRLQGLRPWLAGPLD